MAAHPVKEYGPGEELRKQCKRVTISGEHLRGARFLEIGWNDKKGCSAVQDRPKIQPVCEEVHVREPSEKQNPIESPQPHQAVDNA